MKTIIKEQKAQLTAVMTFPSCMLTASSRSWILSCKERNLSSEQTCQIRTELVCKEEDHLLYSFVTGCWGRVTMTWNIPTACMHAQSLSNAWLSVTHRLKTARLLCPLDFPSNNTEVGCHFLLQGIFLTQGSNPNFLHCRRILHHWATWGFRSGTSGKESSCQCRRCKRNGFDLWVRKIPWSRKWQPAPVFLPEKFHGQRSLVGYSPWGHKESDTTEHVCWSPRRASLFYKTAPNTLWATRFPPRPP